MDDQDSQSTNPRGGTTRRDLILKGAVAGALVWAAPVITSVMPVAAAASGPPSHSCCDCVCNDGGTSCYPTEFNEALCDVHCGVRCAGHGGVASSVFTPDCDKAC